MLKSTLLAVAFILVHSVVHLLQQRYLKKIELYLARVDGFMDE